tara:strand:- start:192 stop:524 length:333 start_codon:yes stop_codon:yes gene_type:complete
MNDKTKEQLLKQSLRYTYDISNDIYTILVPAKKWNDNMLTFECPFCYTKYKNNGQPYKRGILKYHFHGLDCKDKDGNYGLRTPHCSDETKKYWNLPNNYVFKLIGGNLIY